MLVDSFSVRGQIFEKSGRVIEILFILTEYKRRWPGPDLRSQFGYGLMLTPECYQTSLKRAVPRPLQHLLDGAFRVELHTRTCPLET